MAAYHAYFKVFECDSLNINVEFGATEGFGCNQARQIAGFEVHGAVFCRGLLDDGECFVCFGACDNRAAVFDDAGFFRGNFRKGIAEAVRVVIGYGCDYRDKRFLANIGGVSSSAQAYFKHNIVRFLFFEVQKSYGGNHFKFRRGLQPCVWHLFYGSKNSVRVYGQILITDIISVKFDSFIKDFQKGRGIKPHFIPAFL